MIENRLDKEDTKYLKTAIRLLRQGNTMLKQLSEKTDMEAISIATAKMHTEIETSLKRVDGLDDYLTTGKYIQLSFDFDA